jgi:DNA-binding transcriptional LysR family regulator
MEFDIKQLKVFVQVAEHASFSRAAEVLVVAQASVSERIANLEKALGAKLLNRLGRKVELTQAGAMLLARAGKIIELRDETAREIRSFLGLCQGTVLMGGSTAPGEYLLPALLASFFKEYPEVKVNLTIGDSKQIVERVENGDLEIGLVGRHGQGENLVFRKTVRDKIVLIVHPNHAWTKKKQAVRADDLLTEPWILRERGSGTRAMADKHLKKIIPGGLDALRVVAELGSVTAACSRRCRSRTWNRKGSSTSCATSGESPLRPPTRSGSSCPRLPVQDLRLNQSSNK